MLIKNYRKQKKLTQSQVAETVGVTLRQYQDIESGKSFTTKKVLNALEDLFEKPQRVLLAKRAEEVPNYMKQYL
ncbi:helix-turn-helix domain-containing protein [Enterococcus hirae]|uniref:helix-turn-helix domain-containing protein n=1 Tax=Enterococcus hirae TaxID=1354 RepID=UPI001A9599E2|nr:helix-turn-helix transcriptional regulator [Enterococcus hirae]